MTTPKRRKTPYVSMNVTLETRDALQALTFQLQAEAGRRIPMSRVLQAALKTAEAHPSDFREHLAESLGETQ